MTLSGLLWGIIPASFVSSSYDDRDFILPSASSKGGNTGAWSAQGQMTDRTVTLNNTEAQHVRAGRGAGGHLTPPCACQRHGTGAQSPKVTCPRSMQGDAPPLHFVLVNYKKDHLLNTATPQPLSPALSVLWCLSLRELRYRASYISFHYVIPTTIKLFLFSWVNSFNLSSMLLARQRQERKDTKHALSYLTVSSWQRNVPNLGDPRWGGPVARILQKLISPWLPKLTMWFMHQGLNYTFQSFYTRFCNICISQGQLSSKYVLWITHLYRCSLRGGNKKPVIK